jgi:hypothetical protein
LRVIVQFWASDDRVERIRPFAMRGSLDEGAVAHVRGRAA